MSQFREVFAPKANEGDAVDDAFDTNWRESFPDSDAKPSSAFKRKESLRKIKSGVNRMIDTLTRNRFGIDIPEKFQRRKFLIIRNVTFQN